MVLIRPTPILEIFQLSATRATVCASVYLHFLTARTDHAAVDDSRRDETRSEQLVASKQRVREIKQHKRDKKCRDESRKCWKPIRLSHFADFKARPTLLCVYLCVRLCKCLIFSGAVAGSNPAIGTV
jgi:hypothetical protein